MAHADHAKHYTPQLIGDHSSDLSDAEAGARMAVGEPDEAAACAGARQERGEDGSWRVRKSRRAAPCEVSSQISRQHILRHTCMEAGPDCPGSVCVLVLTEAA
eukprot:2652183-Rhodomonas_salina.1